MKLEKAIKQEKFKSPYQKLMVNLAYTNSYVTSLMAGTLKPYDISMQQYNVLRILRGQYPKAVSINSITDRMIDRMSNASRLVEKLRKKSYIERCKCEDDKRRVDVTLTDKGIHILKELDEIMPEMEKFIHHLDKTEVENINELLDKLRKNE